MPHAAIELCNLMQIRAFSQVVAHGSVSRAAEDLYRSQSVITRAIRDLEGHLGVELFERQASGMLLTDFGKCMLPRARRAIDDLHQVPHRLARLLGKHAGERYQAEPLYLFNLRRLQIFTALCESRHMQSVARQLGLSQPAVSAALKVLEDGAGVALMERTPYGLVPSLYGREIEPNIRRALNELRHLRAEIDARRGVLSGTVRVGALPLGRTRLLPEAIIKLIEAYPGLSVTTNESDYTALTAGLRSGDIDFIFGALRDHDPGAGVYSERLFSEDMAVLVRDGHPLLQGPVQAADLAQARWVLPRSAAPARHMLDACFLGMGIAAPQAVVETGDLAMVRGLLLGSDLLAAVSVHQLEHELRSGLLRQLPLTLPDTSRDIGLTYRSGCLHSPAAQALIDCLRERCAGS
jgi:LysR family transcriptional regulator of gallate degradation